MIYQVNTAAIMTAKTDPTIIGILSSSGCGGFSVVGEPVKNFQIYSFQLDTVLNSPLLRRNRVENSNMTIFYQRKTKIRKPE